MRRRPIRKYKPHPINIAPPVMARNHEKWLKINITEEFAGLSRLSCEAYGLLCHLRLLAQERGAGLVALEYTGEPFTPKKLAKLFRIRQSRLENALAEVVGHGFILTPGEWLRYIESSRSSRYAEAAREIVAKLPHHDQPILIRSLANAKLEREASGHRSSTEREPSCYSRRRDAITAARERGTHTEAQWRTLCELFDFRCVRCLVHVDNLRGRVLTRDHVEPVTDGGSDSITNIQPLCRHCNSSKGARERRDWRTDFHDRLSALLAEAASGQ